MTDELEKTISVLKRELLDQKQLLVDRERRILELEDEVMRLRRTNSQLSEQKKLPEVKKSVSEPPKRSSESKKAPSEPKKAPSEPKKVPEPKTQQSTIPTTPERKTERSYSQRKDPLTDFGEIPGMDDDEAHLNELLNGGRPSTPPPKTETRARSAPQVLGTPEKTRQQQLDILHDVRRRKQQEHQEEAARKEYERHNLVIKPVETLVKTESDHQSFARAVMGKKVEKKVEKVADKKNKVEKKPDHKKMEKQNVNASRVEAKATEVAEEGLDKRNERKLLGKFFQGGREDREKSVLEGSEPPEIIVHNDDNPYELNDHRVTHLGRPDRAALRREAEAKRQDLEETSLFFMRERFLTPDEVKIMTEDMKVFSVTECLRSARGGVEVDEASFAICGVITSSAVKMVQQGGESAKVIHLRLGDLNSLREEWTVALTARSHAIDLCLHWRPGSVVVIVNPTLRRYTSKEGSDETGLTISSGNNNLGFEIGITADIGRCEANTRTGERCKRVIYKRKRDMCNQHTEIREKERKKKESRLRTADGSSAPPTSARPEFNSVVSLVKGTTVTTFKPQQPLPSKSFKRPSAEEQARQRKENDKVTEGLLTHNPRAAETVFGKPASTKPLPKSMRHHQHPDDPKIARYQDNKRMSDYVLEKPDRKVSRTTPPTEPAAMRNKSEVSEAIEKHVLRTKNMRVLSDDDDSDDSLEITDAP
ncbi:hypothetical protein CJU89_4669 [Yarrowia sp. B02]|nr:hypothetical protein CJU89_4669 [Yarrowia sp. B02]